MVNIIKGAQLPRSQQVQNFPATVGAGMGICSDRKDFSPDHLAVAFAGASSMWRYDMATDGFSPLPNSGASGTFGAGACGVIHPHGPSFSPSSAGTGEIINTSLTLQKNLSGHKIRVSGTPDSVAGEYEILYNTIGANAQIVLTTTPATPITTTHVVQIYSGRFWFLNPGTWFGYYDFALGTWTSRSVTNLPTIATDGQLIITAAPWQTILDGLAVASATTTILTITGKAWATNRWANHQLRITGGTGKGQIRSIASSTANTITVASAFTVTPDATSVFEISGNEDHIYHVGSAVVGVYRYSISGNAWSVAGATTARAAAPGAGCFTYWARSKQASWHPEGNLALSRHDGRYLYSFRGGATATLDVYDICLGTWANAYGYANASATFTTGDNGDVGPKGEICYLYQQATGRVFKYQHEENCIKPFSTTLPGSGTVSAGNRCMVESLTGGDLGAIKVPVVYCLPNGGNAFFRIPDYNGAA